MYLTGPNVGYLWSTLLELLLHKGRASSPRNFNTYEFTGVTLQLKDSLNNILVDDVRNPSYRFMVAEWLYIWFGHDDVATIARYNRHIAKFSDNGIDFNGAYGPPVNRRWPELVHMLQVDPHSRQAVLPIYRVPVGPTKDVPCTISLQFLLRDGELRTIACMRSSDVWLGLPYDIFNFTMLGNIMAAQLNAVPGAFTIHLGSSHLYQSDVEKAQAVLELDQTSFIRSLALSGPPRPALDFILMRSLDINTFGWPYSWDMYSQVLLASTNEAAKYMLRGAL